MDVEDSSKIKKLKTQIISPITEEVNVHYLNNDCLVNIFQYLSLKDRLKTSLVCKRWNLLCDDVWRDIKILKIDNNFRFNSYLEELIDLNGDCKASNFIINVIKKCGSFLKELSICYCMELDFLLIFKTVASFCDNLIHLGLHDIQECHTYTDKQLEILFKSLKSLKSITLDGLVINGDCLFHINPESINRLKISDCKIESAGYLHSFLCNLKNLNKFEFYIKKNPQAISNAIDTLIVSKCNGISEFGVSSYECKELLNLLSCQKKICSVNFDDKQPNKKILEIMSAEFLEKISNLFYSPELSHSLSLFYNLKYFSCTIKYFTDDFALVLCRLINLKEISIDVKKKSLLTKNGVTYLRRLQNIESFTFDIGLRDKIDDILSAIEEYKYLKNIKLSCKITKASIKSLSLLPNLKYLDISENHLKFLDKFENKYFIYLVKHSKNLELLDIRHKYFVTEEFLKMISDVKVKRKDNHYLKINCIDYIDNLKTMKNLPPLIRLSTKHKWVSGWET